MTDVVRSIKKATAWNRRARINVEQALNFERAMAQHVTIPPKQVIEKAVRTGISFFFNHKNSVGDILASQRNGSLLPGWFIWRQSASAITLGITAPGQGNILSQVTGLPLTTRLNHLFIYLDLTVAVNNCYIFVNKVLKGTFSIDVQNTLNITDPIYLGTQNAQDKLYHDGLISQVSFFHFSTAQTTLKLQEYVTGIHKNGGVLPVALHAACIAHYPLNHRYGDIAYDVIEQYNYAKVDNLKTNGLYTDATWTASAGWTLNSGTEAQFSRVTSGDQPNIGSMFGTHSNSAGLPIQGSVWQEITFDILEEFDGDGIRFQYVIYDLSDITEYFKTAGTYTVKILVKESHPAIVGGFLRIYAAVNTTQGKISNLKSVRTYNTLEANHGALINFVHPWYANHAFDANGYTGAVYSTMTTISGAGITVAFNSDHVEYLVNADESGNNDGLHLLPKLNVETGKTYVVEIDWEFFMNGAAISTRGVQVTLSNTSGTVFNKLDTFARTTDTGEITCASGGARAFLVRHSGGTYAGNSLKIYSIKIYEKGKKQGVDSAPSGVPNVRTNTAWREFYTKKVVPFFGALLKTNEYFQITTVNISNNLPLTAYVVGYYFPAHRVFARFGRYGIYLRFIDKSTIEIFYGVSEDNTTGYGFEIINLSFKINSTEPIEIILTLNGTERFIYVKQGDNFFQLALNTTNWGGGQQNKNLVYFGGANNAGASGQLMPTTEIGKFILTQFKLWHSIDILSADVPAILGGYFKTVPYRSYFGSDFTDGVLLDENGLNSASVLGANIMRVDVKTGLPEIKKALSMYFQSGKSLSINIPALATWGNRNLFFVLDFTYEGEIPVNNQFVYLVRNESTNTRFAIDMSTYTSPPNIEGRYVDKTVAGNNYILSSANSGQTKGICSYIFGRKGQVNNQLLQSDYLAYINGRRLNVSSAFVKNQALIDTATVTLSSAFTQDVNYRLIRLIVCENMPKAHIKALSLYNNSFHKNINPDDPKYNVLGYYHFDKHFDDAGTPKIKDLSGLNNHITMEGFTADQLNPAHADYAFVSIDTFR